MSSMSRRKGTVRENSRQGKINTLVRCFRCTHSEAEEALQENNNDIQMAGSWINERKNVWSEPEGRKSKKAEAPAPVEEQRTERPPRGESNNRRGGRRGGGTARRASNSVSCKPGQMFTRTEQPTSKSSFPASNTFESASATTPHKPMQSPHVSTPSTVKESSPAPQEIPINASPSASESTDDLDVILNGIESGNANRVIGNINADGFVDDLSRMDGVNLFKGSTDIAVIGLAVMGKNLILNMNDHGFPVCAFNRTVAKVDTFLNNEAKGTQIIGVHSIQDMVTVLQRPRRIMLLVQAGAPVQSMIDQIVPHLEKGDIIIDGGNSEYHDSNRRHKELKQKGILFVGCGVSGGEGGARHGLSLMPGGDPEAWPHLKDIFQSIATNSENEACCDWLGEAGSGHFVKMVHNGIEYGDMQLIAEAYDLLLNGLELSQDEIANVYDEWNKGELDSFLIEITANILRNKDEKGESVVPKILDSAGQKGTGKWTGVSTLENGHPVSLFDEAVFIRCLSALKKKRVVASKVLPGSPLPKPEALKNKKDFIFKLGQALYASKIVSYAQGFMLLAEASRVFNWKLNFGAIALMWRGGSIRSRFLGAIKKAFDTNPNLENLLLDDFFKKAVSDVQESWRIVIASGVLFGIPTPAFSSALAFYDGYRRHDGPTSLLQA